MSELIIIAGPQAAGKSTFINNLSRQRGLREPVLFPLQESRQIVIHKHMLLGGIFMSLEHEMEVVNCDLGRMELMYERNDKSLVYLDECNVFTIAHALAHGFEHIVAFWQDYLDRLEKLNAKIVFIDVPPSISWNRRWEKYQQRLVYFPEQQHSSIMGRYREYLEKMHPRLLQIYERMTLPKEMVDGTLSVEDVAKTVSQKLASLSESF